MIYFTRFQPNIPQLIHKESVVRTQGNNFAMKVFPYLGESAWKYHNYKKISCFITTLLCFYLEIRLKTTIIWNKNIRVTLHNR